jgi:heat shock 70kDa protein 1/2/6/8
MTNVIGIDLGTTYSCCAIVRGDKVAIIPNDQGNFTTPSYVSFTDTERLVGESAKSQCGSNAENTIFDAKRFIGSNCENDMPFKVIPGPDGPTFQVTYMREIKYFKPEEISSMILAKMKEYAEAFIGAEISQAVITVPAYFNDGQRAATINAGKIAGLEVLKIINEPTAAALAYGLNNLGTNRTIMVFDLGGGTFDVSILTIEDGVFVVKSTAGNTHLGGEDFDNRMMKYFIDEFSRKNSYDSTRIRQNPRAMRKLQTACEKAKRILSSSLNAMIEIDSFIDSIDFYSSITRSRFEEINIDLFRQCLELVNRALTDSKLTRFHIDDIVLIGGSTRIPKIQQMLHDMFNEPASMSEARLVRKNPDGLPIIARICRDINPDEAVAYGAAIQAEMLKIKINDNNTNNNTAVTGSFSNMCRDIVLIDVTPLSLGLETADGMMSNLIDRNSQIPATRTKTFTTREDYQSELVIKVYEGERTRAVDNHILGVFEFNDIPLEFAGIPQIDVTFSVDICGILTVTAEDQTTKRKASMQISARSGRLDADEIDRMIREAEEFADKDKTLRGKIISKNRLESYVYKIGELVREISTDRYVGDEERSLIDFALSSTRKWMQYANATQADYEYQLNMLESYIDPIIEYIKGGVDYRSGGDYKSRYQNATQVNTVEID